MRDRLWYGMWFRSKTSERLFVCVSAYCPFPLWTRMSPLFLRLAFCEAYVMIVTCHAHDYKVKCSVTLTRVFQYVRLK